MSRQRERGFTMIQLMVAIMAIAILSAIFVPMYTNHTKAGRKAKTTPVVDITQPKPPATLPPLSPRDSVALCVSRWDWTPLIVKDRGLSRSRTEAILDSLVRTNPFDSEYLDAPGSAYGRVHILNLMRGKLFGGVQQTELLATKDGCRFGWLGTEGYIIIVDWTGGPDFNRYVLDTPGKVPFKRGSVKVSVSAYCG